MRPDKHSHHKEGVGRLHQALELVLLLLQLRWRVEQIDIAVEHLKNKLRGCQRLLRPRPAA
jgi:hypothetical protein